MLKANGIAFPLGRQAKPIFIIRKNSVYNITHRIHPCMVKRLQN